jgi:hypothetical protein
MTMEPSFVLFASDKAPGFLRNAAGKFMLTDEGAQSTYSPVSFILNTPSTAVQDNLRAQLFCL